MTVGWPERLPLIHGHAVAFPRLQRREATLPLDAQPEVVLFGDDLAPEAVDAWVRGALAFWSRARGGRGPAAMDKGTFKRFRHQILHPPLDFVPRLGARLREDAEVLCQLTESQSLVLRGLFKQRRLRVSGGAGTGKTLLALEAARRMATEPGGARVLLMCYNRRLASYLAAEVAAWEGATADVAHFHRLCYRGYQALGKQMQVPAEQPAALEFWEHEAPSVLFDALAEGALEPWDAIVVDEAQDFSSEWWTVLEQGALRDPEQGRLYAFLDPAQKIFERATGRTARPVHYELGTNHRNTRQIAEVVRKLGQVELEPHPQAPEGQSVDSYFDRGSGALRKLDDIVRQLVERDRVAPDQIVVLGPHRSDKEGSTLHGVSALGGVELTTDHEQRAGKVLASTISGFKGLESDVVVLVDIDPDDERCSRGARYVAASRARSKLVVFARGEWEG